MNCMLNYHYMEVKIDIRIASLEKMEMVIKNGQSRDTVNIAHKSQRQNKAKLRTMEN